MLTLNTVMLVILITDSVSVYVSEISELNVKTAHLLVEHWIHGTIDGHTG